MEQIVELETNLDINIESNSKENIDKLHTMAKALVEFETLDSDQIEDIMAGASPRSNDDDDSGNKKKRYSKEPSISDPANQT